jgi:hypothetical protein
MAHSLLRDQPEILKEDLKMKTNEAVWDRSFRIVLGLGLLSLTVIGPQTWFGFLGLIPLATGVFGFCPIYKMLGMSTCPLMK